MNERTNYTGIDTDEKTGLYRAFVGGECFGLYHTAQEAHDRVAEIVNARIMAQGKTGETA